MGNYYKSNGIYKYLKANKCSNFYFVSGDMWWLVYADKQSNPKLLVIPCTVSNNDYENDIVTIDQHKATEIIKQLSNLTGLPFLVVRFSGESDTVDRVKISSDNIVFKEISLLELKDIFKSSGLQVPAVKAATHKYLNSVNSSAYHQWQRQELGYEITVSDLDLIKIENNSPVAIYELKRSYRSLDSWQPYRDDYANFEIISKLAKMANMNLEIIYNVFTKEPYNDDVSQLMRFSYDHTNAVKVKQLGKINISDFVK